VVTLAVLDRQAAVLADFAGVGAANITQQPAILPQPRNFE